MSLFKRKASLPLFCAVISLFTVILYNIPVLKAAASHVSDGFGGILIMASLVVLLTLVDYMVCILIAGLLRRIGRIIIALSFILNSACIYFICNFDIWLDDTMMGNIFGTNYHEASGYFCWEGVAWIVILGILPALYILLRKVDYGRIKNVFKNFGITLGIILAIALANMPNWPWMDKNSTELGSLVLPWSYSVNTFRYAAQEKERNRVEIPLPDATITNNEKRAVILVIGESQRKDHFSIYGYGRETCPNLSSTPGLKAYNAKSAATYTTAATKAIIDYKPTDELYEVLPNYLYRNGVDVTWRTSNWGEPPLHIEKYYKKADLAKMYPGIETYHDEILFEGLRDLIVNSEKDKILICIQTYITHGPDYNRGYPADFEVYKPVCTTVEMAEADHDELMNSYDNTILFTDHLLGKAIEAINGLDDWKTTLIFLSDHGESLGENKLYMHGMPMSVAPKEQFEIPFCVWSSDPAQEYKDIPEISQYHVFHSVMGFLGIDSPIYDENLNLYKRESGQNM